jgi:hypothetical protein
VCLFSIIQIEKQAAVRAILLYTAMTRTQEFLTIFNAEPKLSGFAQEASKLGLLDYRQPATKEMIIENSWGEWFYRMARAWLKDRCQEGMQSNECINI